MMIGSIGELANASTILPKNDIRDFLVVEDGIRDGAVIFLRHCMMMMMMIEIRVLLKASIVLCRGDIREFLG